MICPWLSDYIFMVWWQIELRAGHLYPLILCAVWYTWTLLHVGAELTQCVSVLVPVRWSGLDETAKLCFPIHSLYLQQSKRKGGLFSFLSRCDCMFYAECRANCGLFDGRYEVLPFPTLSIRPEMRARKGHSATLFISVSHCFVLLFVKCVLLTCDFVWVVFFFFPYILSVHFYLLR
jgi:hypothetical protein